MTGWPFTFGVVVGFAAGFTIGLLVAYARARSIVERVLAAREKMKGIVQ